MSPKPEVSKRQQCNKSKDHNKRGLLLDLWSVKSRLIQILTNWHSWKEPPVTATIPSGKQFMYIMHYTLQLHERLLLYNFWLQSEAFCGNGV